MRSMGEIAVFQGSVRGLPSVALLDVRLVSHELWLCPSFFLDVEHGHDQMVQRIRIAFQALPG